MTDVTKLQDIATNSTSLDSKLAAQKILSIRDRLKNNTLTKEDAKTELVSVAQVHVSSIITEETQANKYVLRLILDTSDKTGHGKSLTEIIDDLAAS